MFLLVVKCQKPKFFFTAIFNKVKNTYLIIWVDNQCQYNQCLIIKIYFTWIKIYMCSESTSWIRIQVGKWASLCAMSVGMLCQIKSKYVELCWMKSKYLLPPSEIPTNFEIDANDSKEKDVCITVNNFFNSQSIVTLIVS